MLAIISTPIRVAMANIRLRIVVSSRVGLLIEIRSKAGARREIGYVAVQYDG